MVDLGWERVGLAQRCHEALLKIGDSPYKRESVLETASIIAKWKFGGPTEEKYLNRTSKATIIANRTNFPSDVLESDNPGGDLIDIANEFLSQIDDYLDGKIILDVKDFEPKKLREERTINPITNCKSRIHWTRMEDDILIKELMDGKSFADIGEKLKIRSANSCRDRVRNIIKQLTNEKAKESSGILMNLRRNTSRSKQ
ncbi:uncharacterized protein MONOS_18456 [Monocercomonoides exilis]|uniref:uncharacterized protein n=1 Tax=Monocercomonoides exilis TaxID=2049356 RepID=UPI00355A75EE|nr:hypothetical protein MONOS_18456 [Monocercomonoides exilis]